MPLPTDRVGRQRVIAEALLRIAARDGLEAVSVRAVASEAGTSLRMVQRQFTTKDEMLLFALEQTVGTISERLRRLPTEPPMLDVLRRYLFELLPLDEQRTAEARVYLAFAAKAAVDPASAEILAELQLQRIVESMLRRAERHGEIPAASDIPALASMIACVADGATLALLSRPPGVPPDDVLAGIDAAFAGLRAGAR